MTTLPMAGDAPPIFPHVAIIGCGLIGGSLGLAVRARWPRSIVVAVDRKDVIEKAMPMGAADVGGDDLAMASGSALIVLAAPVLTNNRILAELADAVDGEALVTDVGSTKRSTIEAARGLPSRLRFVGGHPLAGAAVGGVESARADLFRDRPWILTPTESATPQDRSMLAAFVEGTGASVHFLDPDSHDALLAAISHLPQIAVSALMEVVGERAGADGLALAGRGLRDTTRLASSPADIWLDIVATNADNVDAAIDALIGALMRLRQDLRDSDGALERTFDAAAQWRRVLDSRLKQE